VEQLEKSDTQRKGAVRKHLNKAQPGETIIILPETPAPADALR
jgi:TusA-related sulfurtransferase